MDAPTLVVSNPPHGHVDLTSTAQALGLDLAGTRLKVAFPAPEVLSSSEAGEAVEFASALRESGLRVAVMPGEPLADVPWPCPVSSLVFDDHGLTASLPDEDVHVPYGAKATAVYCRPPSDFTREPPIDPTPAIARGDGPAIAEAIQWMSNLDLYYQAEDGLRRISIVPPLADFSSLGDLRAPTAAETMSRVITRCRERFSDLHLDARLQNVRPRQRFVMGETGFDPDQRKRYSFGTLLLCHVLDSIAPGLRDVPQFELGSRLALALSPLGAGPA